MGKGIGCAGQVSFGKAQPVFLEVPAGMRGRALSQTRVLLRKFNASSAHGAWAELQTLFRLLHHFKGKKTKPTDHQTHDTPQPYLVFEQR